MWSEVQSWWQNLNPEWRGYLMDGAVVLGALLGGQIIGVVIGRMLRARRFDSLFRVTPPPPDYLDDGRNFSATTIAGLLIRLTVWTGAAWWVARSHGEEEFAAALPLIVGRTWSMAGVMAGSLALAGLLARRVIECLEGCNASLPTGFGRNGAGAGRSIAGPVGAGVYGLVIMLTLIGITDFFNWSAMRTAVNSLWQLSQNLLLAGASLLVGVLGGHWARGMSAPQTATGPERIGQYTAVAIIGCTTTLAVGLLLFPASLGVGVVVVALACVGLYFAQRHFPDIIAGLKLRKDKVTSVWKDGFEWKITRLGLLHSDVGRLGEIYRVQNRDLLAIVTQGVQAPAHNTVATR